MKILMVSTSYPRRAGDFAGNFVAEEARALAQRQHSVTVIAPHAPGLPFTEELPAGVTLRRVRYWRESSQCLCYGGGIPDNLRQHCRAWLQLPFWWLAMSRAICAEAASCDIIHAQWTISGALALRAAASRRIPLVVTARGSDLSINNAILKLVNRKVFGAAGKICCVSEAALADAVGAGASREKTMVLPNGTGVFPIGKDMDKAKADARVRLGLPADAAVLLFIGRLVKVKNLPMLMEVFRRVGSKVRNARLVVVGEGPEGAAARQQVESLGLARQVSFAGERPHAEVADYLAAADCLLLTSDSEGRPNSVLEAMACGVPAVSTNVGGTAELVQDGKTGFLVPANDAAAFADRVAQLLGDNELRRKFSSAAADRVQELGLTWEKHAERLEAVYHGCMRRL